MSDDTKPALLLAAALEGAADVARNKLGRDVQVVPCDPPDSSAILRFDLPFVSGGRLTWFITNDDATGLSDLLIGGTGDRGAVLTEMHLDALTVAFSDMLSRTVDVLGDGAAQQITAGEIDLGMEAELPAHDGVGTRSVGALAIDGFGPLAIVADADADLVTWLEIYGATPATAMAAVPLDEQPAAAAQPAAEPAAEVQPEPAGPAPVTAAPAAATPAADNVVQLASAAAATAAEQARSQADLDLLMNVPLPLTVELGNTQRTIRELVDFSIGSIIELGKLAGDPLDIKVNDRVIARGEVVVIDEEFGIRVTEIVSPEDRLRGLG
ncbi:MAG: flagellar motor switch protein FliN [Thermoleophilia bacterium]|nr:flagellar motor switch protein FliN [Thermoleophilia bacterium]